MNDTNKTIQITVIVFGVIIIALLTALVYSGRQASNQIERDHANLITLSNQVQNTAADLDEHKLVITNLVADLTARAADIQVLSNTLAMTLTNLDETQTSLKTAQDELVRRDEAINKLEVHNQAMAIQAGELESVITNLNTKIEDLTQKLTATEGDKAALTAELRRTAEEKAVLERSFNDLTALRAQVKKIKRDENTARRLSQMESGQPPEIEVKGAEKQVQTFRQTIARPVPAKHQDLNVEIGSDGSVKVIPPLSRSADK